jgi:hypothetical protein
MMGDYDGVITCFDMETGYVFAHVDEHGGHSLRCVLHSLQHRTLVASSGDNGGIRLWGGLDLGTPAGHLDRGTQRGTSM